MKTIGSSESDGHALERRKDGPAEAIDEAVVLASVDGVGPAMDYMADSGVPHEIAVRVLAGPRYHRRPGSRTFEKVVDFMSSGRRRKKP